jgi:replication factor C subunit 2/4
LLFYGPAGTGKTTTINAIARQLYGPELFRDRMLQLNASDERGIGVVRDKIKSFAQITVGNKPAGYAYPCPNYKLIVLDEADSMTVDAQAALRRIMENYSKTSRFCLICNYVSRIIEPLASRCAKFRFRPLAAAALEARLALVAQKESFAVDSPTLAALRLVSGGDLRKAITFLQSAHTLCGAALTAADVIEIAGVVPADRIQRLFALLCSTDGNTFAQLQRECKTLVADGYAAKRVVTQLAELVMVAPTIDELVKSNVLLTMAETDFALVEGADEYLQLLNACAQAHRFISSAPPSRPTDMATD